MAKIADAGLGKSPLSLNPRNLLGLSRNEFASIADGDNMRDWSKDPAFEHIQEVARKIEKLAAATNAALLKSAQIEPGQVLQVVAEVQSKMLRLDEHGTKRFLAALEEKRVLTFSQDKLIMTCVLASAVALREFKNQPRKVSAGLFEQTLGRLKDHSTTGMGLGAFALATFYGVMGRGVFKRFKNRHRSKTIRT